MVIEVIVVVVLVVVIVVVVVLLTGSLDGDIEEAKSAGLPKSA